MTKRIVQLAEILNNERVIVTSCSNTFITWDNSVLLEYWTSQDGNLWEYQEKFLCGTTPKSFEDAQNIAKVWLRKDLT